MQQFQTQQMHSGGLALVLEPLSRWEDFPRYAAKWEAKLGAERLSEPVISADECLLAIRIGGGVFWITYDDFQSAIHLEPQDNKYNEIITELQKRFRERA